MTLKDLKEKVLADSSLGLTMTEIIGVILCDNEEYIYKILKK